MNRWSEAIEVRNLWRELKYKYPEFLDVSRDKGIHITLEGFLKIIHVDQNHVVTKRVCEEFPLFLETHFQDNVFYCLLGLDEIEIYKAGGLEGLRNHFEEVENGRIKNLYGIV